MARFSNGRVSAADVADMARVSRSAVSRTFTAGASVSNDTRERVLAAAAALGYQPIPRTESRAGVDRPVAIIMANLLSPYFAELGDRLIEELGSKDLRPRFFICPDPDKIDGLVKEALAGDVQGLIIFSAVPGPGSMAAAQAAHVPVVILNRSERVEGASLVWIDGPEIGRAIGELMLAEGRRHPLAIAATPFRPREFDAFAQTMLLGGSAPCRWIEVTNDYQDGVRAAAEAFGAGTPPDAVFAASDNLAIGFLEAARTLHGISVPEDLSIIGFGNTAPSHWMSHRISTVRVPISSLIQTAVSTLLARLGVARDPAPRIWLGCDIIERDTTRGGGLAVAPPPPPVSLAR